MALLFLEGFGAYNAATHTNAAGAVPHLQWASWTGDMVIEAMTSDSRGERKWARWTNNNPAQQPNFDASSLTNRIVIGMRVLPNSYTSDLLWRINTTGGFGIAVSVVGNRLCLSDVGLFGLTNPRFFSTRAMPLQECYVEVDIILHNTTGEVHYYLNGEPNGSYTNVDTINDAGNISNVIGPSVTSGNVWPAGWKFSDIYFDSDTVHGPMEIWYQPADSAGSSAAWTPAASTNHSQVDDIGHDSDTTYVESTATGTKDQLGHSHTLGAAPVAIQPMVMVRAVTTAENFQVGIRTDVAGTPTESLNGPTSVSVTSYDGFAGDIFETDPDTGSAWASAAAADAAETVYNHSA